MGSTGQKWLTVTALVLVDASVTLLIWEVSALLLWGIWDHYPLAAGTIAVLAPGLAVWLGLRALLGLYPGYGLDWVEQLRRQTYAVFAALAIIGIFALSLRVTDLSPRLLVPLILVSLGLLILPPLLQYCVKSSMRKAGLWGKPVVVLGYGEAGTNLVHLLKERWELGYAPAAVFDYHLQALEESNETVDARRTLGDVVDAARNSGVDTAIFAMPHIRREHLAQLADLASLSFRHVVVIPNLGGITNSAVVARDLAGTFGVEIKHNLLDPWAQRTKRSFDVLSTLMGGLLISPILFIALIAIKLDSAGPAIFVQERPGHDGRMFRIYKFRTMYTDAEQRFAQLILENPLLAKEFEQHGKLKDDPRVTRVGAWLRKYSLDELPQLWNVLKADMSLVGPRPYLVSQITQTKRASTVISRVPPGITGLWQVSGRSDVTLEQRLDLDTHYVRNWSVWLDLVVLARTVLCVLLRRGAY